MSKSDILFIFNQEIICMGDSNLFLTLTPWYQTFMVIAILGLSLSIIYLSLHGAMYMHPAYAHVLCVQIVKYIITKKFLGCMLSKND